VFDWLARIAAGRRSADLIGEDHDDDIPDPVGRSRAHYEATARELDVLFRRLVELMIGAPARSASYASSPPSRPVGSETRYATGGG